MSPKIVLLTGSIAMLLAVALGAFGAHGLKSRVDESMLAIWSTATQYQMIHGLGMLLCALLAKSFDNSSFLICGFLFLAGMVFFSGSLYVLVLSNIRILGAVTPIGGVLFLVGWAYFAYLSWGLK